MVTSLLPLILTACGLPNERGTPQFEVPTPDQQLLGPPEPAPSEVRDAAAFQQGAMVEGPLVAVVVGTASHPGIAGRVMLAPQDESTVRVDVRVAGLPAGAHVVRVHLGDCADPGGNSMGAQMAFSRLPRHHDDPQRNIGTATSPEGAPPLGPPGSSELITGPGQVVVGGAPRTTRGSTVPEAGDLPGPQPVPVITEAEVAQEAVEGNSLGDLTSADGGLARHSATVSGLFPDNLGHLVGRAVVVHSDSGAPIACGVLVVPSG